ncbi:hypothetical protein PCANC_00471 [Puccinia coronata f. sp. avenae]|uniref:Secreted protein n=1 Tax=Puccinia coronata f. sp. avenae TaxID=200324 RepID=A0A2N5UMQ7_9BASI|nr:hypothetical protein PCANC_05477 [Puccinia coronata f. sp. avenae]PLW23597.1 hypothetical protein PCASD_11372 [Puccinia coronata f. sp. avenae]PLW39033.1 hypothetical protein PCASD_08423 [Puccinia coronata f. sp. avenae]PLW58465.1 hypothetical protein PCANC_00471 [Puccinia coronata f. sp. avenae]
MVNVALTASCLAVVLPAVMVWANQQHTVCYDYFLKKDGCVHSAADPAQRCKTAHPKPYSSGVPAFSMSGGNRKRGVETTIRLMRRYDTTQPVFFLASGKGNCGYYDSTTERGACLWNGPDQYAPTPQTAGWLNSQQTANCRKQLYIGLQEEGPSSTKYAPLIDGCSFNTTDPATGCFQIGVTAKLFSEFNPNAGELQAGKISRTIFWDFDSSNGQHPENAPV